MKENYSNYLFYFFLFFYFVIMSIASLNVGISHDEPHHYDVWLNNKKIYSNYLLGTNYEIQFKDFGQNFYGIGFQLFSVPFALFSEFVIQNMNIFHENNLIIKHPAIVFLFCVSGIFFKKIIKLISKDEFFSNLSTIFYLLYPYLLGHSLFNTLDIPFMSIWLICTYYIIKISFSFFEKQLIDIIDLSLLGFFTGFLLSIRISGILIFIVYLIFFFTSINVIRYPILKFLKKNLRKIILFSIVLAFTFFIFHPNYWENPLLVIDSIKYMGNHIQTVCTITLGTCMKAQNLPSSYIPIWLFFKLPIIILIGILLFPIIEKKLFMNKLELILLGSLSISLLSILLFLILLNVNLYDEIRHLLFLVPIIIIISLIFLFYFSKKLVRYLLLFLIILFIFQNIKIYPYNYLWLNNFSLFTNINESFEKDYWGISSRKISDYFNQNYISDGCIISNRNNSIKAFLNNENTCFINFRNLHKKNKRPFYVVLMERGLKKGLPSRCKNIHQETIKINFSNEDIVVAKVFKCT